jgi:DNA-binding LacI/PurR family transcriptional regulator
MAVKLRDVAVQAGVSVSTVSNVLNGYTKSGIKKETWDRVRRVANEMGYRPNALARSLKVQRTNTIGFYTGYGAHDARDRFRAEIYTGILAACDGFDLDLHIHGNLSGKSPDEIRMRLCDGRVDGIIVHTSQDDPTVACLVESGFPAVAVADRQTRMPSVAASDEDGMRILVEYLWSRGHRRMMYLEPQGIRESILRRVSAFRETLKELGGEASVAPYPWDDAAEFLRALLGSADRPSVLCAFNDDSAYLLLRRASEAGIDVPADFAVVGYDGLLAGNAAGWDLVTAGVPWERIAFESVRLLKQVIDGDSAPLLTLFPAVMIEGNTA